MSSKTRTPRQPPAFAASFPASTARPSRLFNFCSVTPESTQAVRRILTENDRIHDGFYAKPARYAHNHLPHSTLARYALGAPPALLEADWALNQTWLTGLDPYTNGREEEARGCPQPGEVTRENWTTRAWHERMGSYSAFLTFFHAEVARLGPVGAIREYLLSPEANGVDGPRRLIGLCSGAVHPFIHVGYGLEFGDGVLVAEGLAMASMHALKNTAPAYPNGWPHTPLPTPTSPLLSLLELYAEFCTDPTLAPEPYDRDSLFGDKLRLAASPARADALQRLVRRWDIRTDDEGVDGAIEEVAWLTTMLVGAVTRPGYAPRMDFFLMHLLTSSIFLPSYLAPLTGPERRTLLQTYLICGLHLALSRGRPHLFPDVAMDYPVSPAGILPRAAGGKLDAVGDPADPRQENSWLGLVGTALCANDSHVPKSIRSLLLWSQRYGATPAGCVPGAFKSPPSHNGTNSNGTTNGTATETISGLARVDGSLFLRVAGQVIGTTGWVRDGEPDGGWDRSALGWDAAWVQDEDRGGAAAPQGHGANKTVSRL